MRTAQERFEEARAGISSLVRQLALTPQGASDAVAHMALVTDQAINMRAIRLLLEEATAEAVAEPENVWRVCAEDLEGTPYEWVFVAESIDDAITQHEELTGKSWQSSNWRRRSITSPDGDGD